MSLNLEDLMRQIVVLDPHSDAERQYNNTSLYRAEFRHNITNVIFMKR